MLLPRKLAAEFLGTFWLVLGGTGAAVFAATLVADFGEGQQISVGLGYLGVSLAFGLTVVTGAYALGAVSGGHFNPAITIGAWVARSLRQQGRAALHRRPGHRWHRRLGRARADRGRPGRFRRPRGGGWPPTATATTARRATTWPLASSSRS